MERPHVLLVEGRDDQGIVTNLLEAHGIASVYVKEKGGWTGLRDSLKVELLASGLKSLGVVADADTSLHSRWQSIRALVENFPLPDEPEAGGTIVDTGGPKLGIWLMPDNRQDGAAETFAASLVPGADPLWPRASDVVDGIPAELRRFSAADKPKAVIHTWLAWQERPGVPMGVAIKARFLDPSSASASVFVRWVHRLIGEAR